MHLHDHLELRKRTHTDTHETTGSKTADDNEKRSKMTWGGVCMCVKEGLHNSETVYLRRKGKMMKMHGAMNRTP